MASTFVTKRSSGTWSARRRRGQLEERQQPCSLARAEAVAELLEVAREEAGRIAGSLSLDSYASCSGSARAIRRDSTSAFSSSSRPGGPGSVQAQTAKTIGRPVRSSQRRPRIVVRRRVVNALSSATSPISDFRPPPRRAVS